MMFVDAVLSFFFDGCVCLRLLLVAGWISFYVHVHGWMYIRIVFQHTYGWIHCVSAMHLCKYLPICLCRQASVHSCVSVCKCVFVRMRAQVQMYVNCMCMRGCVYGWLDVYCFHLCMFGCMKARMNACTFISM